MSKSSNLEYSSPAVLSSPSVTLDPAAPGTIIRYAFAIEAVANLVGGTAMILYPAHLLSLGVANPVLDVHATSCTLLQWIGAMVYGLTPQLLLGLANTRGAVESRPMVYWTLLAGEGFLLPLLAWQMTNGVAGLTPKALAVCATTLAGPVVWRLWVLLLRPDWMGRYREIGRKID